MFGEGGVLVSWGVRGIGEEGACGTEACFFSSVTSACLARAAILLIFCTYPPTQDTPGVTMR